MKQEIKQENFIIKATKIHGIKYDYSLVYYNGPHKKIKIICPTHGVFEQTPDSHVRNHGCPKCNGGVKLTKTEFIIKATEKHNNKYNYNFIRFTKSNELIKINCPEHGIFEQTVSNHLFGYGCQICGSTKRANNRKKTTEYFIDKATEVHGLFYDYSKVEYMKTNQKVDIICPKHGQFSQSPNDHISNKNGCPICNESKGEREIRQWLVNKNINFIKQYKFSDCKDIRPLPFDFYLPDHNTCIEYDGEQHFKEVKVFSNKNNNLEKIRKRDNIKTYYCNKKENPNLIRINFNELKNIDGILSELY